MDLLLFFHLAGMIIGLGAVTVIDTLGFIGRNSVSWTKTTIEAHHVTKPLIWLGSLLTLITLVIMFITKIYSELITYRLILIAILILNGLFLSFYISPILDKLKNSNKILPKNIQNKITISFIISFLGWWSFVFLTSIVLSK